jgi:hypothetical protein
MPEALKICWYKDKIPLKRKIQEKQVVAPEETITMKQAT